MLWVFIFKVIHATVVVASEDVTDPFLFCFVFSLPGVFAVSDPRGPAAHPPGPGLGAPGGGAPCGAGGLFAQQV